MPRIAAATVREHRAQMQAKLVEAAERILREDGVLTAGEVAAAAGIARNSLYRYVGSVDDLRILVLNKHLPEWSGVVAEAVRTAPTPRDKVLAHVTGTLAEAAPGDHAWLMRLMEDVDETAQDDLDAAHVQVNRVLRTHVAATGVDQPDLVAGIIAGIVRAGFARLEAGDDPDDVVRACGRSAAAVLDA